MHADDHPRMKARSALAECFNSVCELEHQMVLLLSTLQAKRSAGRCINPTSHRTDTLLDKTKPHKPDSKHGKESRPSSALARATSTCTRGLQNDLGGEVRGRSLRRALENGVSMRSVPLLHLRQRPQHLQHRVHIAAVAQVLQADAPACSMGMN